jgi:hypothetical protein
MPTQRPTATLVAEIKRSAKRRARTSGITHSAALDEGARAAGYSSWFALQTAATTTAAVSSANDAFPVDPALPEGFYETPNDDRSDAEIAEWWDKPYAVTVDGAYDVRCLDGGAWDRPTFYGLVTTLLEAQEIAKRKLASWRAFRERPGTTLLDDDTWAAVRMPQRPREDVTILTTGKDANEVAAWLAREYPLGDRSPDEKS